MYFNRYVYQYRGRLRCKGTKTITASSRTPDFDHRYLPLEHWCLYNSSSIFENDLRYTNSQRLVVLFSLVVIAVCFLNSQRLVVCVCVFFPFILDIKFVGRTSWGHTGGRSHIATYPQVLLYTT